MQNREKSVFWRFFLVYIKKKYYLCAVFGIFNDNFPPILDGVALTAQNYAYWLNEKGYDVSVVTPYAPNSREVIQSAKYPIYRYPSVPIPFRYPYRYGLPHASLSFLRTWLGLHFELVHAHCPFTSGTLAKSVAKRQEIPLVATFHSKYRQDFEHNVPSKPVVDWMIKQVIAFFDAADEVWIPLPAVEETLREYGYKGPVTVVENGNDFSAPIDEIEIMRAQMREELGILTNELMLLYVGQHTWEKNIRFTLESLAQIKDKPFQFFMVGTGYAVREIRRLVVELGLYGKVTLLGNIHDRERLKRIYSAADLFVFPSFYDTCGLVVREAAAMHTPSMMLEGSTASTAIKDGVDGFVCPNDTELFAQRIVKLMEQPQLITKVGNKASNTLSRSWENVMDEVILRYRDIQQSYKLKHGK